MGEKKAFSGKIQKVISKIHLAFMQPRENKEGIKLRKQYWIECWREIKELSSEELFELSSGLKTTCKTLTKLTQKVDSLKTKKDKERLEEKKEEKILKNHNEWNEDEFLDSSACLPVFKKQTTKKKTKGKRWIITKPKEKIRTVPEICQAIWVVVTNRAIFITDKGEKYVPPSLARDKQIEKQRLAVLPHLLDDKTITDPITGKPVMNLFHVNHEVKEVLLWMLAGRAKIEPQFKKYYIKFLKKEIINKAHLFEWAKKFKSLALRIIEEIS